jgi:iron complex transport system ATP-binding protein
MDEPCSSLDYGNQVGVMERAKNLAKQGYLVLMSTHNPEQAFQFADRALVLLDKKIECFGAPKEVLNARLIERVYGIPVTVRELDGTSVCIPQNIGKGR